MYVCVGGHSSVHKAPCLSSMPAVEDQWQQLSNKNGSQLLDNVEANTKQESQNETAVEEESHKERVKSKDSGYTSSTGMFVQISF